ncbi:PVC-type heme-binding CxxCH protein [Ulvibacterium sp.]|uniref:PVC-type heme-binding CxxCH protein n=1 Tax=Ulvibacterium sp. TaxID=2665914 RepID=UPI0026116740|nr:PVC-type heme-binding CxxCH protein [Ulvibacterium sp.]
MSIICTVVFFVSCAGEPLSNKGIILHDPNLSIQLLAEHPSVKTPIGMAIDARDAVYVLESHTHTPPDDYQGPKFDLIKKSVDENGDGIPEKWTVFADSIEDGMNLHYDLEHGLFLTTKNGVFQYLDQDKNGVSDSKKQLVAMVEPQNVYDHAGILGLAIGEDDWLYVSRGNVGGNPWTIQGTDGSQIEGYGDGGNVFRCKLDGSQLEEIATGFWNPFDLKFNGEGRLFVTDNDPDSRGPNRLIEIVPGGDYGYKSVYGGSGIHPFSSWNGELPGTLPFSAPLGEAPCAMIDASFTNFGDSYASQMLVNIWEENNMVHIPLDQNGSSVKGIPEVLIQGDSSFHPVALATNSRGDLFITDWVLREYPNHGNGRLWKVSSKSVTAKQPYSGPKINRFKKDTRSIEQLITDLKPKDPFELAVTRHFLAKNAGLEELLPLVESNDSHLRLQGLLTLFKVKENLNRTVLLSLLRDENQDIQRMTLMYIAKKGITEMEPYLLSALRESQIRPELFETFLATVRHLQPDFIDGMRKKSGRSSKIPRALPKSFIEDILKNPMISEEVKAMALPYLSDFTSNRELVAELLGNAGNGKLQIALIKAVQKIPGGDFSDALRNIAFNTEFMPIARSVALQELSYSTQKYIDRVVGMLKENDEILQYAALKYLCATGLDDATQSGIEEWIANSKNQISKTAFSIWNNCDKDGTPPLNKTAYATATGNGDSEIGRLVFENRVGLCTTCHKINGWGGSFGPELSNIGGSKSISQLVSAVLEPSLEISPEWQGWYLVDVKGTRHTGRQIDVHLNYAELMNTNGEYDTFKNPRSYGVMESSLMPEGLERTMTPLEFNDLITFLSHLK